METKLRPYLKTIANAIREKKGHTMPINAQNFADEVFSINSSGGTNLPFVLGEVGCTAIEDIVAGEICGLIAYEAEIVQNNILYSNVGQTMGLDTIVFNKRIYISRYATSGTSSLISSWVYDPSTNTLLTVTYDVVNTIVTPRVFYKEYKEILYLFVGGPNLLTAYQLDEVNRQWIKFTDFTPPFPGYNLLQIVNFNGKLFLNFGGSSGTGSYERCSSVFIFDGTNLTQALRYPIVGNNFINNGILGVVNDNGTDRLFYRVLARGSWSGTVPPLDMLEFDDSTQTFVVVSSFSATTGTSSAKIGEIVGGSMPMYIRSGETNYRFINPTTLQFDIKSFSNISPNESGLISSGITNFEAYSDLLISPAPLGAGSPAFFEATIRDLSTNNASRVRVRLLSQLNSNNTYSVSRSVGYEIDGVLYLLMLPMSTGYGNIIKVTRKNIVEKATEYEMLAATIPAGFTPINYAVIGYFEQDVLQGATGRMKVVAQGNSMVLPLIQKLGQA